MADSRTTGSERLAQSLKDEGLPVDMTDCWAEFISADPGVKALVSYVVDDDCVCKDLKRLAEMAGQSGQHPDLELCGRCAALKAWEGGDG